MVIVRHEFLVIGHWLGEDAEFVGVESTKVKSARFLGSAGYLCFLRSI